MKKLLIIFCLVIFIATLFIGCTKAEYNSEQDRSIVVAKVNGVPLYKAEINDRWSTVLPMMEATFAGMSDDEIKEKEQEHRLEILDSMIKEEINRQKAESSEFNIVLTDEEIDNLTIKYNEVIASMEAYIMQNFNRSGIFEVSEEQMTAELKAFFAGQGTTREDFFEDMKRIETRKKLRLVIEDEIVDVSSDETEAFYKSMLAEQQKLYSENTGRFEADMRDGDLVLNILEGYRVYKKIFVPYKDEDMEMVQLMINSKLEAETTGAIEVAFENLGEELEKINEDLETSTKTFDELMQEYNPTTADKEYYISDNTKTYTDDTKKAAISLENIGEHSIAVPQTNGAVVWMLKGEVTDTGVVPLEDVYEEVEALALDEKRSVHWEKVQEKWFEESEIKIYKNRVS